MLLMREHFPEEDELVLCTVKDIQYHSVFVKLDEFVNRRGMIHISEIAPGRIKNIREYVTADKKIVCKVLRIDKEKGHIDLSLRRVNEAQRRKKINEIKQEQAAEKIIEHIAKEQKKDAKKLFNTIYTRVIEHYDSLYHCFEDIVKGEITLESLGIEKTLAQAIDELVKQRVKAPEARLGGELKIISYDAEGIELVKKALAKGKGPATSIKYAGAGAYAIEVKGEEPKETEKTLKKTLTAIEKFTKKYKLTYSFERKELA